MKIQTIILYIIIAYLGLLVFAYLYSDFYMFYPPAASYKDSKEIIKLKTQSGNIISAVYLPNKKAKYILLVSHGNGEDLGQIIPRLKTFRKTFQDLGMSVFAYDYPGYGTSTGRPSEKSSYEAINAAYQYLIETLNIPPNHIILFGNSIGAGVSIDLATRKPVAALILQSPFVTAFRVVTYFPLLPFDKYNNLQKIKQIHVPILIIHGKRDRIIPFWHGKKLYNAAHEPKEQLWIDNVGHNDIFLQIEINHELFLRYKTAIKNLIVVIIKKDTLDSA